MTLATLVEEDETLGRDELVILDGTGAVTWRGDIYEPGLADLLRDAALVRLHPWQAARQVALATGRGDPPIALG